MGAILDDFAAEPTYRGLYPDLCVRLGDVRIAKSDWGIREGLERTGFSESENREFWRDLHDFWTARFFAAAHLHRDVPIPGAVEYVQAVLARGAHIMYLTGREQELFLSGTRQSLRDLGFPVEHERVRLVLKPHAKIADAEFKVEVLRHELPIRSEIWLFENEPVNLNLMRRECPAVHLVLIESAHSGLETVDESILRAKITDFLL